MEARDRYTPCALRSAVPNARNWPQDRQTLTCPRRSSESNGRSRVELGPFRAESRRKRQYGGAAARHRSTAQPHSSSCTRVDLQPAPVRIHLGIATSPVRHACERAASNLLSRGDRLHFACKEKNGRPVSLRVPPARYVPDSDWLLLPARAAPSRTATPVQDSFQAPPACKHPQPDAQPT